MPKQKAAFKALRQTKKHTERNRTLRKKIKDLRKKAERALIAKKLDEVKAIYVDLQKAVDKASKTGGFLSRNTAARYKSRLLRKVRAVGK